MKTIILQSFRTYDVPSWLHRCIHSVKAWVGEQGWDYEYLDDDFFTSAPEWVRVRCAGNIYAITDICRLLRLRDLLDSGYERVVWVDADILVFASEHLNITTQQGHAFAHELYLHVEPTGRITPIHGLNNAFMVFERDQLILDAYLNACFETLHRLPPGRVPRTALGPRLLYQLGKKYSLEKLFGIGLFTYSMMRQIIAEDGDLIRQCIRHSPAPLGAANLCHFLRNRLPKSSRSHFDSMYGQAVSHLLEKGLGHAE